ncbi:MarR family winged helix-turn-helix transcriptional regulator [Paramicrobacterium humi]|nr:MarR family transcriptional regulator [Microbacterium humi]
MTTPRPETDAEVDEAIGQVEAQFNEMYNQTRLVLTRRAAEVHPELSIFGFKALRVLQRQGECPQGGLVEALHADKGVVSRTVRHLEELGLVERTTDADDRRVQLVALTEDAGRRLESAMASDRTVLRDTLMAWDAEEIRRLRDLIAKLNESLAG